MCNHDVEHREECCVFRGSGVVSLLWSGHRPRAPIPGVGAATAAVLTAKIGDIDCLAGPNELVGYFGVFPDEESSAVDKSGKPLAYSAPRSSPLFPANKDSRLG
jgi:hypothetical protein